MKSGRSRLLRNTVTVLLLTGFFATCRADDPVVPLRFKSVSLGSEDLNTSSRSVPSAGNLFATVHLEQDAKSPDKYDWIRSVAFDASDHPFEARYVNEHHSESGTQGFLGRKTREVHPIQIAIQFEIPKGATLKRMNTPLTIRFTQSR